ncbi:putative bifunctional diguanylate cyclase/phosphodiesterase [Paenibacillus daejeonensis]|uniref:putative bifunctional diguanylate cyclase/phosphodiesterase n=1 Tax=Paenibacillus daejeonensis TaxID=135193 RepID=UPI0003764C27|nr:EAL domain-containing protein [Paenibacillus daejeonensis]
MRYKATLILCLVILTANGLHMLYNEFSAVRLLILGVNIAIAWFLGRKMDQYLQMRQELSRTKENLIQYSYGLDSTKDGIGITNEAGRFEYVNHAHIELYGYSRMELLHAHWSICYSHETQERVAGVAVPALRRDGFWRGEAEGVRKDGTTFPQELVLSQIRGSSKVFCVVRDLTEHKGAEAKIRQLALTNEVTGLPNRRSLLNKMADLMAGRAPFYVLFVDVDRFKHVNDTLGHEMGDQLLLQVAQRLGAFENEEGAVFHFGGDEFILLLQCSSDQVKRSAAAILASIGEPFDISGMELNITVSIGISGYPDDHEEWEGLIGLADTAMYQAKLAGKNRYQIINHDIKAALKRKAYLETELKKAIRNRQLELHYQPILELEGRQVTAVEALLRWNHPQLGMVSPAEFVPLAEETGMITDIGRWVIQEALTQAGIWGQRGYSLGVSINVSQRQLGNDRGLVDYIRERLAAGPIDPAQVVLEITESVMEDYETIIPVLNELRQLGLRIALDDFGTGFSSLSFIKRLPINMLKIDQSFIRELTSGQTDVAIIKSILELAINLELTSVAEGVETPEQVDILKRLQCSKGQGYLFSKPLPAQALESWLAEQSGPIKQTGTADTGAK